MEVQEEDDMEVQEEAVRTLSDTFFLPTVHY